MEYGWLSSVARPHVTRESVVAACAKVFPRAELVDARPLSGGLVNLNTLVTLDRHDARHDCVLRAYVRDVAAAPRESALLSLMSSDVPVPAVLGETTLAVTWEGKSVLLPALLMSRVPGERLADVVFDLPAGAQRMCAHALGEIAAAIHAHARPTMGRLDGDLLVAQRMTDLASTWLDAFKGLLKTPLSPLWFPKGLHTYLADAADRHFPALRALDDSFALLHADFKPTNVLVDDAGRVQALLDWEFSWSGPPLFDVGQMVRYALPDEFQAAFADAYVECGGELPNDWRWLARCLDVLNLAQLLARPRFDRRRHEDITRLLWAFVRDA